MSKDDHLIRWLERRLASDSDSGLAKYERLYRAIQSSIRDGVLAPGDKLPPEQVLSRGLPISLATVRKCFARLAQSGVISREHGRGTFVSTEEHGVSDLWHFRFIDPDAAGFMPIYNRIISRRIVSERRIAERLGTRGTKFVFIERAVNIGARFVCYSELYLPAEKFSRLMDEPVPELERVNLKDVLTREYRSPTLRADQFMRVEPAPETATAYMDIPPGALALRMRIIGYTFDDQPISYQQIWIPETEHELSMPTTAELVRGSRPASTKLKVVQNG